MRLFSAVPLPPQDRMVEVPAGIVAQIMGHKPSAIAEKHYYSESVIYFTCGTLI